MIDLVFGMIVLGVILSDAFGPILTHRVLRRTGDIPAEARAASRPARSG